MAGEAMGGVGKRVQGRVLVELPGENVLAGQPGADLSKLRKFLAHAVRRPVRSGLATGAAVNRLMDCGVQRSIRKAHALADVRQEITPQPLLPRHGAEGLFQQIGQRIKAGAPAELNADSAKAQRGQALTGRKPLIRIVEVGNDLLDTTLCPREFAVEALLADLELAESSAVELIRALQRGDTAGEEGMLDALGCLG